MSNVPRGKTNEDRRLAEAARWPVLVRLAEVPTESVGRRAVRPATPGGNEYRFDPPQDSAFADHSSTSAESTIRIPQPNGSSQPHTFDRRLKGQRRIPSRQSSVLPHSNPFSNPRPRLMDSVAPAIRFLTLVALFTAVGIWVQMMGTKASPPASPVESPTTAAHPPAAPAKNAVDHTVPAPTATGPLERVPESGARVGRTDGDDDFAAHGASAAVPVPSTRAAVNPPHFLISSGSNVPRVRVADSNTTTSDDGSNGDTQDSPAMARHPGFSMEIPTR